MKEFKLLKNEVKNGIGFIVRDRNNSKTTLFCRSVNVKVNDTFAQLNNFYQFKVGKYEIVRGLNNYFHYASHSDGCLYLPLKDLEIQEVTKYPDWFITEEEGYKKEEKKIEERRKKKASEWKKFFNIFKLK